MESHLFRVKWDVKRTEVAKDRALKLFSYAAIASTTFVARPQHPRANIKVLTLGEDPRVAVPNCSILQVQHIGP